MIRQNLFLPKKETENRPLSPPCLPETGDGSLSPVFATLGDREQSPVSENRPLSPGKIFVARPSGRALLQLRFLHCLNHLYDYIFDNQNFILTHIALHIQG